MTINDKISKLDLHKLALYSRSVTYQSLCLFERAAAAAAAAAAKSLQSCLTLCNPIDSSPPGSPIPRKHQILEKFSFFLFSVFHMDIFCLSFAC